MMSEKIIYKAFQIDPQSVMGKEEVYDAIARIVTKRKECEVVRILIDLQGKLTIGCFVSENDELMPRGKYIELYKWTTRDELYLDEDDLKQGEDDALFMRWKTEKERDETDDSFVQWLRDWYPSEYDERLRTYIYENLMDQDPLDEWVEEISQKFQEEEV